MEGVDTADRLNGYYSTLHKAKNYLLRHVFEQTLMQALMNAWLLFRWWLQVIVAKVNVEVELHRYPLSTVRRVLAAGPCTGLRKMTPQKGGPETVINPAKVMDGEPVPRSSGLRPGAPSAYREAALLCFGRFA